MTDENVESALVAGLQRRVASIDIVRVQTVGLRTLDDPTILQWAADHGRALISRDIKTMPGFAHERIASGMTMPGVFVLSAGVSVGSAIEELALVAEASDAEEWADLVVYLPLR